MGSEPHFSYETVCSDLYICTVGLRRLDLDVAQIFYDRVSALSTPEDGIAT